MYENLSLEELQNELKIQKHIVEQQRTRQMVIKVVLNSLYGCLGNKYFRWFQVEHAEAITWSGQLVIQWAAQHMNDYLNKVLKTKDKDYIIAMDTDSLYITLNDLVESVFPDGATKEKIVSFLDKACSTKLTSVLNEAYDELATSMNAFENKMSMKRESIAEKGIWTGKKRYILSVWDQEGVRYDKPKTKITGIESVRSTTPMACKQAIKDAIEIMIKGSEGELIKHIADFKKKYIHELALTDIAIPSGVNGMNKYYDEVITYITHTPQHVKGALVYNKMRIKKGVEDHPPVYDGDKIKMFLLKKPNPTHEDVISVPTYLPKEFNMDQHVDRDAMFERSYLGPVKKISEIIGWQIKKENKIF